MGFGELYDNVIKGLMFHLRYHEQGFMRILLYSGSCMKESNKRGFIIESQACCEGKQETSVHKILLK